MLTVEQTCFACMDIQVSREPVNEIRYEDPTKAFIMTDTSGRSLPDYFSSASSARDTASSAVSTILRPSTFLADISGRLRRHRVYQRWK